ncbi:AraC family transcriptional regulator [Cohnella rhizosphaerae]|uniref:AraC family transcriptional regulator n=1 Tax=Cohnella rhizosphaerae TaxID=1457232 RepID=UPI003B8A8B8C
MNEPSRLEQARQRLANAIQRHAPRSGTHRTAIPDLTLLHAIRTSEPLESVYKPSICIVAQGAKTAAVADGTYTYDPMTYLVTSVELPIFGKIVEASPEIPYLSLKLCFDADVILDVAGEIRRPELVSSEPVRGITVSRMSPRPARSRLSAGRAARCAGGHPGARSPSSSARCCIACSKANKARSCGRSPRSAANRISSPSLSD